MFFFMCVSLAVADPVQTAILNEPEDFADISSDIAHNSSQNKPKEQQDVDFKKGVEQGRADAKMKTPEIWREGLKKGAIYGALDGFIFGGTIGFGGIVSFLGLISIK